MVASVAAFNQAQLYRQIFLQLSDDVTNVPENPQVLKAGQSQTRFH